MSKRRLHLHVLEPGDGKVEGSRRGNKEVGVGAGIKVGADVAGAPSGKGAYSPSYE